MVPRIKSKVINTGPFKKKNHYTFNGLAVNQCFSLAVLRGLKEEEILLPCSTLEECYTSRSPGLCECELNLESMNKNSEYSPEATSQRGRCNEEADGAQGAAALGNLVAHVILSKCTREGNCFFFFPVTNMKPVTVKHPCRKFRITLGSSAEERERWKRGEGGDLSQYWGSTQGAHVSASVANAKLGAI